MSSLFSTSLFRRSKSSLILIAFLIVVSIIITFILARAGEVIRDEVQAEVAPRVGGDIVIQWSVPLDEVILMEITDAVIIQKWIVSQKVEMNYTLTTNTWPLLVSLRWVDTYFPVYGDYDWLELEGEMSGSNLIFVSQALFEGLSITESGPSLTIQSRNYPIWAIFSSAPWAWLSVFDWGRQIIMPLSLVKELGLLVEWSRLTYKTLIALPDAWETQINQLQQEIKDNLWEWSWLRVSSLQESEWVFQSVEESLSGYLWLISLLFLLLEVCVLMFLGYRIVHENQSSLQIMRIYWLRNRDIRAKSLLWVCWCLLLWALLWITGTYFLTNILLSLDLLWSTSRSFQTYIPVIAGISLLTIWVASLPIWLATREGPLSLLDKSPLPLSRIISWKEVLLWGMLIVFSYFFLVGNLSTVLIHLGSGAVLWIIVWWCIWWLHTLMFTLWTKARWRKKSFAKRDVLRFLTKPGTQSSMITGWCTVLMILLSWTVMTYSWLQERLQWLTAWWDSIFVTNVFDDDLKKIDQLSFPVDDAFNIILGRIVSVNWRPLKEYLEQSWSWWERRWFAREFNMTSNDLQDIPLTSWTPLLKEGDLSVDEEFAESIGLWLKDKVVISIAGREFPLTVVNTRSSVREGIRPFFYFQLVASQFQDAPKTSFFQVTAEANRKSVVTSEIVSLMWNNVSIIDTWDVIAQVKEYVQRIWLLLSFLFWLMLLYALSAIFSLFSYAWIFQRERFDVYELLWAGERLISSLKAWYISIYLLISGSISLLSCILFFFLFKWSEIIDVSKRVLLTWVLTCCIVVWLIWIWAKVAREK